MLLQEFDPNPSAVINPWGNIKPVQDCPRVAVSCFELRTFDRMVERLGGVEIMRLKKANWDAPVYRTEYKGVEIALFEAYVGAAGCMSFPPSPGKRRPWSRPCPGCMCIDGDPKSL